MTRYVLHGGGESDGSAKNDGFFREIAKDLSPNATVLVVYFALPKEDIASRHPVYEEYFRRNAMGKPLILKIATEENFIAELRAADAVYFRGGDTELLLENIKRYPDFSKEVANKAIVAGSSAGVHFLCKYGLSSTRELIHVGLGILPFKSYCHVNEDNYRRARLLDKYDGELLLLEEGEFRIVDI